MSTCFVVCQHGNEETPLRVIRRYSQRLTYVLANPAAYRRNARFMQTDLNRSFPGRERGSHEEKLAKRLLVRVRNYEQVVDLHTATCSTPMFAILTKVSPSHIDLVRRLGVKRVVYMAKSIASGRALIDHVNCGVSIECGNERSKKTAVDIEEALRHFISGGTSGDDIAYYLVYEILRSSPRLRRLPKSVRNFQEVSLAGEKFYPVLARERNYKGTLCLMAKRTTYDELMLSPSERIVG